jgi:MoaA/NifB/PqqE/SkfB family radical SAM enzyme
MKARAENPSPRAIRLEASSFCQLRCPSCPTTSGAIHPAIGSGFLRLDDFRKLLDENLPLKMIELSNYGEIFLNPHLLDILALAQERKVSLTALNGANLNTMRPELLEGVVKHRLRAMICSIDGASPETYSIYRVRGDFTQVIANIKAINAFKKQYRSPFPRLVWQFVVFGHNEHELPAAREMARELAMEFHAKLTWDSEFAPVKDLDKVRYWTDADAASREDYEARHGEDYMQAICHQLWDVPQINWDGKVLGCCRNFWGDFGGNAFTEGLAESLRHEKLLYARHAARPQAGTRRYSLRRLRHLSRHAPARSLAQPRSVARGCDGRGWRCFTARAHALRHRPIERCRGAVSQDRRGVARPRRRALSSWPHRT